MSKVSASFKVLLVLTLNSYCASKLFTVYSSADLKTALLEVSAGDNVSLSGNTTFHGNFIATKNGSLALPITIRAANFSEGNLHAQITGEERNATTGRREAALTISGDHYNLENLKIENNRSIGLLIQGTDSSLNGLVLQNSEKAVRIKGSRSYLKDCHISNVHFGIQIEGDFSIIQNVAVKGAGIVSVTAGKETCCGNLVGNTFEGKVDIKGTDYNLRDNVIEGKSQENAIMT